MVTIEDDDEEEGGEVAMATEEERTEESDGEVVPTTEHFTEKISRWQQLIRDCDICKEFEREKGCIHVGIREKPEEVDDNERMEMNEAETQSETEVQTADSEAESAAKNEVAKETECVFSEW